MKKYNTGVSRAFDEPIDIFIARVNATAIISLDSLLRRWLPGGQRQGNEYVSCNPTRGDKKPGSFKINLRTGVWCDFATGDAGGDPVSLFAYLNYLSQGKAAWKLARELGVSK